VRVRTTQKSEQKVALDAFGTLLAQKGLKMARPPRFERGTLCLEGRCSIQLSYGRDRPAKLSHGHAYLARSVAGRLPLRTTTTCHSPARGRSIRHIEAIHATDTFSPDKATLKTGQVAIAFTDRFHQMIRAFLTKRQCRMPGRLRGSL
jgi:hypothetical protein